MLVVKVDDLNNIKVEPEEVHPMYSPVSYNAGYNQALKDIKEAYNGLTVYDTDIKVLYLCDKNVPNCSKTNCSEEFCCHTTDINHAKNFAHVVDDNGNVDCYVESHIDTYPEVQHEDS